MNITEFIKNEIIEVIFSEGKIENIKEVKKSIKNRKSIKTFFLIKKEILLSKDDFKNFNNNFFKEYDFLKNTCEWIEDKKIYSGVRVTDGKFSVIIDTQGYNYARYVGKEV